MSLKNTFRYILYLLLGLLALNLFIVPLLEPSMIYFPVKGLVGDPGSIGLKFEDIYLKAADGVKLNAWYLDNKAAKKVILLLHGNGGNISHRLDMISVLHALPANVFIIDYHGYGNSEGEPNEQRLYLAAKAAYKYLVEQKKYQPDKIIVMGSSLGGAVAAYLAVEEEVGGLILQRTFTSAKDMAVLLNPLYRKPFVWLRSSFDNLGLIKKVKAPKLIIHSKEDEVIPYTMSERLFARAEEPKELLLLDRGGHNDIYMTREYIDALQRMINR